MPPVAASLRDLERKRLRALVDEVFVDGGLAVLRYRSAIDIHVQGQQAGRLACWHTDCYRATAGRAQWWLVRSQATEIPPGSG
jgi:hypothetical protein